MNDTEIGRIIQDFKDGGINLVRDFTSYSFGNREECIRLFAHAFVACDKSVEKVKWLPEYNEIIEWMTDTKGKGLFLQGDCGRGKSVILRGVLPVIFKYKHDLLLNTYSATDINKEKDIFNQWCYAVDDVGIEPVKNDYGEKSLVVKDLFEKAEQSFKPIFVTTNLNGAQFLERYDKRTLDRVTHLCKIVKFRGESLRK